MNNVNQSLIKVFTKDPSKGNPAFVVSLKHILTEQEAKQIAKTNKALTVFIYNNDGYKEIRFFTAKKELPFCGHGLIAASYYLMSNNDRELKLIVNKKEITIIKNENGFIQFGAGCLIIDNRQINLQEILDFLNIPEFAIDVDYPLTIASIGSPKLLVPVKNLKYLQDISPDFQKISKWSAYNQVNGMYVYTKDTLSSTSDFHTRSFNPLFGIDEDIATGVAAGALCGVIHHKFNKKNLIIEQGHNLNHDCRISTFIDIKGDIQVGGFATYFKQQSNSIPIIESLSELLI